MLDALDTDPAAFSPPTTRAIPAELYVEGYSLLLSAARLSDGRHVSIVGGYDRFGEECELDDEALFSFVAGCEVLGWWACALHDFFGYRH